MSKLIFVFAALIASTLAYHISETPQQLYVKHVYHHLPKERIQEYRDLRKSCNSDSKIAVADSVFEDLYAGKNPSNPNLDAQLFCIYRQNGVQQENGQINAALIKQAWAAYYTPEEFQKLSHCIVQKETPEATALNLVTCALDSVPGQNYMDLLCTTTCDN